MFIGPLKQFPVSLFQMASSIKSMGVRVLICVLFISAAMADEYGTTKRFCGRQLAESLALICEGEYETVHTTKRSGICCVWIYNIKMPKWRWLACDKLIRFVLVSIPMQKSHSTITHTMISHPIWLTTYHYNINRTHIWRKSFQNAPASDAPSTPVAAFTTNAVLSRAHTTNCENTANEKRTRSIKTIRQ